MGTPEWYAKGFHSKKKGNMAKLKRKKRGKKPSESTRAYSIPSGKKGHP